MKFAWKTETGLSNFFYTWLYVDVEKLALHRDILKPDGQTDGQSRFEKQLSCALKKWMPEVVFGCFH